MKQKAVEDRQMLDTIVIGGGQAGLATAFHLVKANIQYLVLDENQRTGDSWRKRYQSMRLFTSRAYCGLPGMEMPGEHSGYPSKDELADYLETYAKSHSLKIEHNAKVISLTIDEGVFTIELNSRQVFRAKAIVIAAGAFQVPLMLDKDKISNLSVPDYTISSYQNAENLPKGTVLVVGDGASGRQIALDATSQHKVILATGKKRNTIPQRLMGVDIFNWLDKIGILWADSNSLVAKIVRKRDPFPGKHLNLDSLESKGIEIVKKVTRIEGNKVFFSDGMSRTVDAIVWAMGFKNDTQWLQIPGAISNENNYLHSKGVSPIPGLFYIGLPWQTCRASSLLTGLEKDSDILASQLNQYLMAIVQKQKIAESKSVNKKAIA